MARKQKELPGVENPASIKEIDDAAEAYNEVMKKRVAMSAKEKAAKETLVSAMKKHNLVSYTDTTAVPPINISLSVGKDSVKLTQVEGDDSDEEEFDA